MKEKSNSEPFKKEVVSNLEGVLPRVKITFGDSVIVCKNDSLFGNYIAYSIQSESDLSPIREFISKLNELFM